MNRRKFLQTSTAAAAGTAFATNLPAQNFQKKTAPSDQVRIGVIGANNMGWSDMKAFFKTEGTSCVAIADVDQSVLEKRASEAEKQQGFRPKLFRDYRKMLEMRDLDVVVIGTPDHWHCLQFCDALAAGKHVYCEKPIGRTIEECKIMLAAARRFSKQLVQVGQWQRSGTHYDSALQHLKSGAIGKVRLVKVWSYVGWKKAVSVVPDSAAPEGVDYDFWLGPAPRHAFNPNRFHFEFRWFWDYAGGLMTDWGVHQFDIALVGMGLTTPKTVMASGGKFGYPDADGDCPDTMQAVYEYDGCTVLWEHALGIDGGPYDRPEGIAFIGNDATLVIDRSKWAILPERQKDEKGIFHFKTEKLPEQWGTNDYIERHTRNLLDCIRDQTPEKLNCGIETAANIAINCCMGNIAQRVGRKLTWDAEKMEFREDSAANQFLLANYQNGWTLPKF